MKDRKRNLAASEVPLEKVDSTETTEELYDSDPLSDTYGRKLLPASIEIAHSICSDVANAQRLYWKYGDDLIYVAGIGWYVWEGRYWKRDQYYPIRLGQCLGRMVAQDAIDNYRKSYDLNKWAKRSESRARIESAITLLRSYLNVEVECLDADPYQLNVANGTVYLHDQTLHFHDRDDRITRLVDIPYDPNAECPLFLSVLHRVLGDDQSLIDYFQRVCGYCLTGSVQEQKLFILYGIGANGKSTIVGILMEVLGSFAKLAAPNLLLSSTQVRHPTELADLMGARLVVASEMPENGKLNENQVKQLTGGDTIKGRFMRQDFFEFKPTHKFMIMTNHKPSIQGSDIGIWRRIHLIPFLVVIPTEEQDQDLPERLKKELSGILRWCVEGCADWLEQGLNPPEVVTAATAEYRQDQDVFSQFLDDCCTMRSEKQVRANVIYKRYQDWCLDCGELAMSQVTFWQRLSEKGITKTKTSQGMNYRGIEVNQQFS